MVKIASVLAFALMVGVHLHAQSIHSVHDGMWMDSATWDMGRLPRKGDSIWVRHVLGVSQTIRIDSGSYLDIDSSGALCMAEDSLLVDCGAYLHNDGIISVYYILVHDGLSNSCIWFHRLRAGPCDVPVLFHIDGTNCDTPPCPIPPPSSEPLDSIHYPRITTILYPNPTVGDVWVRITHHAPPLGDERYVFVLYDLLGKALLRQAHLISGDNQIALPSNLAKGAYIWHVFPHVDISYDQSGQGVLLVR